ncbi:unnamed protein product [Peniophora sp. CBMAI 1063]|nr:unnamed protein product [Peniophora sp. CBMAI 1063]
MTDPAPSIQRPIHIQRIVGMKANFFALRPRLDDCGGGCMMSTDAPLASALWIPHSPPDSQPGAFCELASFVILYYDFSLTFSQEIAHIWPRPLSRPALLFFFNRYPMLFGNVAFILFDIVGVQVTSKGCDSYNIAHQVLIVFAQGFVSVLLALRIDAIYEHAKPVRYLLVFLGIALLAVACWACFGETIGGPSVSRVVNSHNCFENDRNMASRIAIAWGAQAVFDVSAFALTVWHSFRRRRRGFTNDLLIHVYQGGAVYFGVIVLANTINLVSLTFQPWEAYVRGSFTNVASCICVTMMSRLILHLYDVAPVPASTLNDMNVLSVGSLFATELTQRAEGSEETWHEDDPTAIGHADGQDAMPSSEGEYAVELEQRTGSRRRASEHANYVPYSGHV